MFYCLLNECDVDGEASLHSSKTPKQNAPLCHDCHNLETITVVNKITVGTT